jgi:hypothetical protein
MYDVDDTLVLWDGPQSLTASQEDDRICIKDPYDGCNVYLRPHNPHIKLLQNHKARGKFVVVWSQGGFAWAEAVVKALGLTEHVDLIMSKPRAIVDDLPPEAWMKDRIYIKPDSHWGVGLKEDE